MFKIKNVYLTKSSFELHPSTSTPEKGAYDVEVSVSHSLDHDNILTVTLSVFLNAKGDNGTPVLSSSVMMDGVFEVNSEISSVDYIANVNAPAIMYPFIRQHIADLTMRSSVGSILLPPFNFVADYKEKLSKENATQGND